MFFKKFIAALILFSGVAFCQPLVPNEGGHTNVVENQALNASISNVVIHDTARAYQSPGVIYCRADLDHGTAYCWATKTLRGGHDTTASIMGVTGINSGTLPKTVTMHTKNSSRITATFQYKGTIDDDVEDFAFATMNSSSALVDSAIKAATALSLQEIRDTVQKMFGETPAFGNGWTAAGPVNVNAGETNVFGTNDTGSTAPYFAASVEVSAPIGRFGTLFAPGLAGDSVLTGFVNADSARVKGLMVGGDACSYVRGAICISSQDVNGQVRWNNGSSAGFDLVQANGNPYTLELAGEGGASSFTVDMDLTAAQNLFIGQNLQVNSLTQGLAVIGSGGDFSTLAYGTSGYVLTSTGTTTVPTWTASTSLLGAYWDSTTTKSRLGKYWDSVTAATRTSSAITAGLAAFTGTSSITTLGTIATGTWAGTTISDTHGGTGLTGCSSGDQVLSRTTANSAWECRQVLAGANISVGFGTGTITITNTGGGGGGGVSSGYVDSTMLRRHSNFNGLKYGYNPSFDTLGIDSTGRIKINTLVSGTLATGALTATTITPSDSLYGLFGARFSGIKAGASTFTGITVLDSAQVNGYFRFPNGTATRIMALDANKKTTLIAETGTGNVMLSASPTTTGTMTAATINASGNITANKFLVTQNVDGQIVAADFENSSTGGSAFEAIKIAQDVAAEKTFEIDYFNSGFTGTGFNRALSAKMMVGAGSTGGFSIGTAGNAPLRFATNSAENMRLFGNAHLSVGDTVDCGSALCVTGKIAGTDSIHAALGLSSSGTLTVAGVSNLLGKTVVSDTLVSTLGVRDGRLTSSGSGLVLADAAGTLFRTTTIPTGYTWTSKQVFSDTVVSTLGLRNVNSAGTGIRLATNTAAGLFGNATTIAGNYTWSDENFFSSGLEVTNGFLQADAGSVLNGGVIVNGEIDADTGSFTTFSAGTIQVSLFGGSGNQYVCADNTGIFYVSGSACL